jgi:ABC-type glycerol-3-phosphate transport system substrate-binding protein
MQRKKMEVNMKKKALWIVCLMLILVTTMVFAQGQAESDKPGKFVMWDKSEYVSAYNDLVKERFYAFAEAQGIEAEYIVIPPNDLKSKLLAAIEAKNTPDLVVTDDFLAKQFAGMGQLVDVSDIKNDLPFYDAAINMSYVKNGDYVVPLSFLAPGLYLRKDKWDAAGLDLPVTWEDYKKDAYLVNDPKNDFYALGFPMGASGGGDAEGMMRAIILSYGGALVDENDNIVVNSPETLEALKYISSIYLEGLAPPSAITWDDMGNNNAYLAGTIGVAMNSGSIYSALKNEKPELLEKTMIRPWPAGPAGSFTPSGGNVFVVFKNGKNSDAAKLFIRDYFKKDFYENLVIEMGGMWQPVVKGMDQNAFWKDPTNAAWLASSKTTVPNTYPAVPDENSTRAFSEQVSVKAVQKIVVNGMDPQQALDELEADLKRIYNK